MWVNGGIGEELMLRCCNVFMEKNLEFEEKGK
jgi:hypothetical protein